MNICANWVAWVVSLYKNTDADKTHERRISQKLREVASIKTSLYKRGAGKKRFIVLVLKGKTSKHSHCTQWRACQHTHESDRSHETQTTTEARTGGIPNTTQHNIHTSPVLSRTHLCHPHLGREHAFLELGVGVEHHGEVSNRHLFRRKKKRRARPLKQTQNKPSIQQVFLPFTAEETSPPFD